MNTSNQFPCFFTATCLEWKHLLKPDKYKEIVIKSLEFLGKKIRLKYWDL
jgi:putative transposase